MPAEALTELETGLGEAAGVPVELERPADPTHGDYATNVALRLAKERGRPPRAIAEELTTTATSMPDVLEAVVAGPGFVNLTLADSWYGKALAEMHAAGRDYGAGSAAMREHVQVEMVSANPTGPLTVGSARNGAYGDSVARLLAFAGHDVEREYYYNDAGAQIERFRASVEARRRGEPVPEDGYQGAYVGELAKLEGDPLQRMLAAIEASLERFRIHFDSWALESELGKHVAELISGLDTYEEGGALWIRSTAYGDDKDRVLVRSEARGGTPTYEANDIAYLRDKLERGFDRVVYVLGADHHGVRRWYEVVARMLGYDPSRVEVLLYQLVHVVEGGAARKVSKRRGDVVLLDELIDRIGVDAARWYLVTRGPDQTIEVDLDTAADPSRKNPVHYPRYAHARIAGILRNADGEEGDPTPYGPLAPEERALVKRLVEFPRVVAEATERRGPHALTVYVTYVSDDFHRFYHDHRVLEGGAARPFRIALVRATQAVIARSLDLVGVEAPERM